MANYRWCVIEQYSANCALHTHTQMVLSQQDEQLDMVGASVTTLKKMGETIGDELDDQQE